jgi:MoaA/NifB/PqqE/SkfB family radical SAM enzyme
MSLLKKARIGSRIVKTALLRQKRPLSVTFTITGRCNLNCAYCSFPLRKQKDSSTEQVLKLIDEFHAAGVQRLGFSGGEPLLHGDIDQIISKAQEKGMFLSMTTNGTLIPKKLDVCKKMDVVLVSLDGPQAVHDLTGKEKVEKLLESIHFLKKNKIEVCTSTVLSKPTIEHLDELFTISKEHSLMLSFQPYAYYYFQSLGGKKEDRLGPTLESFKSTIRRIIEAKKQGMRIANSYEYLDLIKNGTNPQVRKCLAGQRYCYVDTNGDVYPCSPMTGRMKAYNAFEIGFADAFKKIPKFDCKEGCLFSCYLEYNFQMSLSLDSIRNVLRVLRNR